MTTNEILETMEAIATRPKRVLLADDDDQLRSIIKLMTVDENVVIDEAADGEEAIRKFEPGKYDLVVLDLMMPKLEGVDVALHIRSHHPVEPDIVMFTGFAKHPRLDDLKTLLVTPPVVQKPVEYAALAHVFNTFLGVTV